MANWKTFALSDLVPSSLDGVLQGTVDVGNAVVQVAEAGLAILNILKVFLISLDNPAAALVDALIASLRDFLEDTSDVSLSGLFLIPQTLTELARYQGGYGRFRQLFIGSLNDLQDTKRPQFDSTDLAGGLFLFTTRKGAGQYLFDVQGFLNYFRQPRAEAIQMPPPVSIKVRPADKDGNTEGSIFNIWADQIQWETLRVEFEEPKLAGAFVDMFGAQKVYVERSTSRLGELRARTQTLPTPRDGKTTQRKGSAEEGQTSDQGKRVYAWEPFNTVDLKQSFFEIGGAAVTQRFIAGAYTLIMQGVEKGEENARFYRFTIVPPEAEAVKQTDGSYQLQVKGKPFQGARPSAPQLGVLPKANYQAFDLPQALLEIYRAAYLYRLDAVDYLQLRPPVPDALEQDFAEIGGLSYFLGQLITKTDNGTVDAAQATVRSAALESFRDFDPFGGQTELYAGVFGETLGNRFQNFIDVNALTRIERIGPRLLQNAQLLGLLQAQYQAREQDLQRIIYQDFTQGDVTDQGLRSAVLSMLQLVENYNQTGTPPNWESLRLFKDFVPALDGLLTTVVDLLKTLEGFTKNSLDAFDISLDAQEFRLTLLDQTLRQIELVKAELEATDLDINLLWIEPQSGGNPALLQEFLNAGNVPQTDEEDYMAGVALVFGGPDPTAYGDLLEVFRLLFNV